MTDIEALRARMREAINALAAALAALKDGEPEGPRRDGLIAGIEHALNNAKPLDAEITRLRADAERLTRERDEARFHPLGDNHHNAWACPHCNPSGVTPDAFSSAQEEVARLKAELACVKPDRRAMAQAVADAENVEMLPVVRIERHEVPALPQGRTDA